MHKQRITTVFLAGIVLFCSSPGNSSVSRNTQQSSDKIPEHFYAVYNAILAQVQVPKRDPVVGIYAQTLNLRCGEESRNPVLVNGCGGFFMPPDGIEQIHELLKQSFHGFSASTWSDFQAKNQFSIELTDEFHTAWKHEVIGKNPPESGSTSVSDDCTFFFSQPGFSEEKNEAIVFVLMFSYLDGVPSTGDYFLLRLDKAKGWQVKGRIQYYKTDGSGN